ncbi:uncharacterized protein F5147DRAFT_772562 [Suillus discolor]|uniref:Uncharacterized protein n=1 Tax=Suillus discolor TaxID=1912936 RepID=A0A9P7FAI7_9AGAM|nr:uncharacterized protein F5147DRAFT_772562 [Suillus discolor]KAG2110311.1 hypothetical protein F5147DRAFT_772562 [Suillus discolor]
MSSSLHCVCGQQSANDSSFTRHHAQHSKRTIENVGLSPGPSKWKTRHLHPERAEANISTPYKSRRAEMGALSASKLRAMQVQHPSSTDPPIEAASPLPDTHPCWTADDFTYDEPSLMADASTTPTSPHINNHPLGKRPGPLATSSTQSNTEPPSHVLPSHVRLLVTETFCTLVNSFGLMCEYRGRPSCVPDADVDFEQLRGDSAQIPSNEGPQSLAEIIHPYPNMSLFLLNHWFWNRGANKSKVDRKELIENVLSHPDFRTEDLCGINMDKLDAQVADDADSPWEGNGWINSNLTIDIPLGEKTTKSSKRQRARDVQTAHRHGEIDPDAPEVPTIRFNIPNFRHRSLLTIIQEFWKPSHSDVEERVFDEVYTSDAFLAADRELQSSPRETGCNLPRAVAGFMFWSDATHVAQFGQAKLWPIYAYFANQSKYDRCRPTARAAHCVAYLHALPDSITDFLRLKGRAVSPTLLTHCRRELFHQAWNLIIDDDFITAYMHGIIVDCADGIRQRIYPRIFTYSADYPEKVLIVTIRDMGGCPCPRCTIPKEKIAGLGTRADQAIRVTHWRVDDEVRRLPTSSDLSGGSSPSPEPLTPKVHKKKCPRRRDDDSDDLEEPVIKKASAQQQVVAVNKKMLIHKGHMLGRWVDMWQHNITILEKGIQREADSSSHGEYTPKEDEQYDIYKSICSLAPCIIDEVHRAGCLVLNDACRRAHGDDINSIKEKIAHWRHFPSINPSVFVSARHTLGFNNQCTGKLLCPANHGLRDGSMVVTSSQFPCFLWLNEVVDPNDFFKGWLENELLVQGYLHIFKSPSSAICLDGVSGRLTTRHGNAALHGIRTVSIPSIAYVATLGSMSRGHKSQFSYEAFYNNIVRTTFEALDDGELAALCTWWNGRIFSDIIDYDEGDEGEDSVMAMMKAQAAARRAATSTV